MFNRHHFEVWLFFNGRGRRETVVKDKKWRNTEGVLTGRLMSKVGLNTTQKCVQYTDKQSSAVRAGGAPKLTSDTSPI